VVVFVVFACFDDASSSNDDDDDCLFFVVTVVLVVLVVPVELKGCSVVETEIVRNLLITT
jgi:hypothetical protein